MRNKRIAVRILAAILWTWAGVSIAQTDIINNPNPEQDAAQFEIIAQASNLFGGQGPTAMTIDIKPGDPENIIHSSSRRIIPVAIFGSSELDVTALNPRTIRLNGVDVMLVGKSDKHLCRPTDLNDDSYQDLLCEVRITGFKVGAGEFKVILKAATYSGISLKAQGRIKVVSD